MERPLKLSRSPLPSPGLEVHHRLIRKIPFSEGLKKFLLRHGRKQGGNKEFMERYRERRAIFIRVPKNASTSICQILFPDLPRASWPGHLSAEFLQAVDGPLYEASRVFAPIRNPEHRLRSAFNYYRYTSPIEQEREMLKQTIGESGSFEVFLDFLGKQDRLEDVEIMRWHHFRRQADFITNRKGDVIVDMLFPVEDMAPALEIICEWFGTSPKVPRDNRSSGPKSSVALPENIQDHYREDQRLWERVAAEKCMFV